MTNMKSFEANPEMTRAMGSKPMRRRLVTKKSSSIEIDVNDLQHRLIERAQNEWIAVQPEGIVREYHAKGIPFEVKPARKTKAKGQSTAVNFRVESGLYPMLLEWLEKNPDFTMSQVANLALRTFITSPLKIDPVVSRASDEEFDAVTKRVMARHADALERLK